MYPRTFGTRRPLTRWAVQNSHAVFFNLGSSISTRLPPKHWIWTTHCWNLPWFTEIAAWSGCSSKPVPSLRNKVRHSSWLGTCSLLGSFSTQPCHRTVIISLLSASTIRTGKPVESRDRTTTGSPDCSRAQETRLFGYRGGPAGYHEIEREDYS
ncbi:hypothetical protein EJ02DRAFT_64888 [Clathrospora elynae]|uniref:Uncharacterized protein n=1 Tax=Clathrospora elynae TaxID=706981 RepID=A0A6A5SWY4_9PLEO|nr:hypothetical protein EJ02DRAFT_64888 [Clathrospora elynae]